MNTIATYKQALLKFVPFEESKKSKKLVVQTINNSQSRKSIQDDENPIWCFSSEPYIFQMQSKICIVCGNYIQIWNYFEFDIERKIKYIYCNNLHHHDAANMLLAFKLVKDLLKLYYNTNLKRFLYRAALYCILYLKPKLHTFTQILCEYIGIFHDVW